MRPTVIAADAAREGPSLPQPMPAVIGGPGRAAAADAMPAPTRLPAGAAPQSAPILQPVVLGTKPCLPLPLSREDLARRHPGLAPEVVEEMACLLETELPAAPVALPCERLGRAAQQQHAWLVDQVLAASEAEVLRIVPCHLGRLAAILDGLAQSLRAPSWGRRLRRPVRVRFEEVRAEIDMLRARLQGSIAELQALHERLAELQRTGRQLGTRVAALASIADAWAASADLPETPQLQQRALSLGHTGAQLQQQDLLLGSLCGDCLRLCAVVDHAVLIQLPAWLATVAALPRHADLHDTQRLVLLEGLQSLLGQLPRHSGK